jgi:hypothetical protein
MHHTWKLLFFTWSDLDREEKFVKEEAAIKCDGECDDDDDDARRRLDKPLIEHK